MCVSRCEYTTIDAVKTPGVSFAPPHPPFAFVPVFALRESATRAFYSMSYIYISILRKKYLGENEDERDTSNVLVA